MGSIASYHGTDRVTVAGLEDISTLSNLVAGLRGRGGCPVSAT